MKNKFPHLLALIYGAHGDKKAIQWLYKAQYDLLAKVAEGAYFKHERAIQWLIDHHQKELAVLSKKITILLNDGHKFLPKPVGVVPDGQVEMGLPLLKIRQHPLPPLIHPKTSLLIRITLQSLPQI